MAKSGLFNNKNKTKRTISMSASLGFFVLSLIINAAGNVFTLVTTSKIHPSFLGSAYWTAAETNLGVAFHWNLFWAFLILGVAITILNAILVGHWDWGRAIGNIIFMVPFSALIQVFDDFFMSGTLPFIGKVSFFSGFPEATSIWMIIFYVLLNFFGVALIATAISIYQRVNLVLHPADDLMQILRFKYFHGAAGKAMWASYIPPTVMAVVAFAITHQFTNFGLGTIFAFLFQGGITGWADKYVFPHLKHQSLDVGQKIDETEEIAEKVDDNKAE